VAGWVLAGEPAVGFTGRPMLPIIIEDDLKIEAESTEHPVLETIYNKLELLTGGKKVAPELLRHLLRRQRLLVIVDHFLRVEPGNPGANPAGIQSRGLDKRHDRHFPPGGEVQGVGD
jgi:hypothetical protein